MSICRPEEFLRSGEFAIPFCAGGNQNLRRRAGAMAPVQSQQLTSGRRGPRLPRLHHTNSKLLNERDCLFRESQRITRQAAICRTSQERLSQCAARSPQSVGTRQNTFPADEVFCRYAGPGRPRARAKITSMLGHSEGVPEKKNVPGRGQAIVGRKNILREKIIRKAPAHTKLRVIDCRAVAGNTIGSKGAIRDE